MQAMDLQVEKLQEQLVAAQEDQSRLRAQAAVTEARMGRASQLISAIGDEGKRWQKASADMHSSTKFLLGDTLISAACVTYFGAFTTPFRQELLTSWLSSCKAKDVLVSEKFRLQDQMATNIEVWSPAHHHVSKVPPKFSSSTCSSTTGYWSVAHHPGTRAPVLLAPWWSGRVACCRRA